MKPVTVKLDRETEELLAKANVHRVGRGIKIVKGKPTGEEAWIITVTQKLPVAELASKDIVPSRFKGLATDVVVKKVAKTSSARASKPRTDKWRPAPGGCSIGHYKVTAGTLGNIVYKDRLPYILSNNHILANINDATIGDPILQPGKADGGELGKDEIARLHSFIPIKFEEGSLCPFAISFVAVCNLALRALGRKTRLKATRQAEANIVDCALAKPDRAIDVLADILEIGEVRDTVEPTLGMPIRKSGRTTGLTSGHITEIDVTAKIQMGGGKVAIFTDLFATEDISDPGDSGSQAVSSQNKAPGLLFAGSDTDTLFIKQSNIKEAF